MPKTKTGLLLKLARSQAKMSQGKLGKLLGYDSPQFISNIERGLCGCPIETAKKVSKILKIDKKTFKFAILADYLEYYEDQWKK